MDFLVGGTLIRAIRLLMISDLLILYIMYLIISFILKKSINSLKLQDQVNNTNMIVTQQKNYKKWEKEYLLMFGDHAIALGFVLSFSPYAYEIIASMIYVIIRVVYEIRRHKFNDNIVFLKTVLRIINLSLIIAAMLGISRTNRLDNGSCQDPTYSVPTY